MCNTNHPKLPCKICAKNIHGKDKPVQHHLCDFWIHIKCNKLNYLDYRHLQNCGESWYCKECCNTIFPFNSLSSNKNFLTCCADTDSDSNITQWKDLDLHPSSNLELLVNQFKYATPENSNDTEKICSSKYYDIEEMCNIEIPHKKKLLSQFQKNTCFLKGYLRYKTLVSQNMLSLSQKRVKNVCYTVHWYWTKFDFDGI